MFTLKNYYEVAQNVVYLIERRRQVQLKQEISPVSDENYEKCISEWDSKINQWTFVLDEAEKKFRAEGITDYDLNLIRKLANGVLV